MARFGVDIFGSTGVLEARFGDISLQPWGGAGYTLPEATYGVWARRDGAWLKAYVATLYAHAGDKSISFDPTGTTTATLVGYESVIDETLPFGAIKVPVGRVVTWEIFLHYATLTFNAGGSGPVVSALRKAELFASLNGAGSTAFNFLYGPAASGTNTYSSVKLRITYGNDNLNNFNRDQTATIRRVMTIRLFSHEVNSDPTLAFVQNNEFGAVVGGDAVRGADLAHVAAGSESGGYAGSPGGGGDPVI